MSDHTIVPPRKQGSRSQRWQLVGLLPLFIPLAFLLLFFFYPLGSILSLSLAPDGKLSLSALDQLVRESRFVRIIGFTLGQAALSTVVTLLAALPGAYAIARYDFPGKYLVQALSTVPFVLPTIVVALAFTALLGPQGRLNLTLMRLLSRSEPLLDLRYTLAGIIAAHIFYNYTLVLRIVGTFWANLDPRLEEAARVLGAGRWRAFREVTLPLLLPAIGAATLLVFTFCFTSFGVVLILGGPRFSTLEVEIYRQTIQYLNLPVAAALSLVQMAVTLGLMLVYTQLQRRLTRKLELRSRQATQRPVRRWQDRLLVLMLVSPTFVILLPLLALIERSVTLGGTVSLSAYFRLFSNPRGSVFYVPPIAAVWNSVLFAWATVVLSVLLGLMAAVTLAGRTGYSARWTTWLDPILMLPLGTSAVTLGLGYIVALGRPPLDLRSSPVLVVLAHTLVALPFVVRSVLPGLRAVHPHLRETAAVLGASPWRVWRHVDWPIVSRAALVGAVFAFTVSMGEFGATSLIARPERPTLPIAIYRFLGRPGAANYGQALAMSTLLMLVCIVGFLFIERFRVGETLEF